jgi:hypothetical protein
LTGLAAIGARADDEVYGPPDPLQGMVDELGARQGSGGDDSGQPAVGESDSGPGGHGAVYGPPDSEVYGPPAPSDSALDAPPGSPDSMDEMRYSRPAEPEENQTPYRPAPDSFDEIVRRSRDSGTGDGQQTYDTDRLRFPSTDTVVRPGRSYPPLDDDGAYRRPRSSTDVQDSDDEDDSADSGLSGRRRLEADAYGGAGEVTSDVDSAPDRAPSSFESDEPSFEDPPAAEETPRGLPEYGSPEYPVEDHGG